MVYYTVKPLCKKKKQKQKQKQTNKQTNIQTKKHPTPV